MIDPATAELQTDANDFDVESAALSIDSFSQPVNGTLAFAGGVYTYTPAANFFGDDSFTYTVLDADGATDTATVTITVASVNDAPNAADDFLATPEDTALSFVAEALLANDFDVETATLAIESFSPERLVATHPDEIEQRLTTLHRMVHFSLTRPFGGDA